jgi:hypothetical protein
MDANSPPPNPANAHALAHANSLPRIFSRLDETGTVAAILARLPPIPSA